MAELERLKARRAANPAVVTRLINEASTLFEEEFKDQIRVRFYTVSTQLAEKMTLLEKYNQDILDSIEVNDIEANVLDRIIQTRGEIETYVFIEGSCSAHDTPCTYNWYAARD